jgi:vacuolar-type H+-ATPase subunit H
MTRLDAAARESAEKRIASARGEAAELKRQAREAGLQEGQAHTRTIVSQAEEEARLILEEAHDQAKTLRQRAHHRMETGVDHAIHIILGIVREAEKL